MASHKNALKKVTHRNRRRQQELDARREERANAPKPEGAAPSRYRAKKHGGGTVAHRKPRRHLRRAERENYVPTVGAAD